MNGRAEGRGPGAERQTGVSRSDALRQFGAYRKAMELFGHVAEDTELLQDRPHLARLLAQQLASADSIAANIEEGYGRGSRKEYVRFLVISRGSARETAGHCERVTRWLPQELVQNRVALCEEVIAILGASLLSPRGREKLERDES